MHGLDRAKLGGSFQDASTAIGAVFPSWMHYGDQPGATYPGSSERGRPQTVQYMDINRQTMASTYAYIEVLPGTNGALGQLQDLPTGVS